ncbi:CD1375 family protein [Lysinibacillus alkalisoli]|nr:CD1375 family protein [Lysinibacillus alkalisoli]
MAVVYQKLIEAGLRKLNDVQPQALRDQVEILLAQNKK